jgi:hypothetical protein
MKKIVIIAAIVAAAGAAAAWYACKRSQVDPTVTQPFVERDLTTDEIRAKMASGDFKQVLEASKQIDKLDPAERLRVLLKLADDPQASTRLLAVRKLRAMDDPRARERLDAMAKGDPDADVRDAAAAPK